MNMRMSLEGLAFGAGFLTRLGPVRPFSPQVVAACLVWFPVIGLGLGLVQAGLFLLLDMTALGLAQGWLYAALGWWATRGLHWDGLADIADAWGSGARGTRFWEICKDSRVGAFGVMGVVLGMGCMTSLASANLARGMVLPLLLAPLFGRWAILALACAARTLAPTLVRPGLGGSFLQAATPARLAWATVWTILPWLVLGGAGAWRALLLALLLAGLPCWRLLALGRRERGLNGDFLGSAALLGEMATLAAWLLAT